MRAIGKKLLVDTEEEKQARLIVKKNTGKVLSVGGEVKEISLQDEVLFGEDYEEVPVETMTGESKKILLMDISNVKLVLKRATHV